MTPKRPHHTRLVTAFAALLAAAGCAQIVEQGPPPSGCDQPCLKARGWEAYEAGRWNDYGYFASASYVDSTDGEAFMGLGYFQVELGFLGAATESFRRSVELDSNLVAAYAGNAFCLATQGDDLAAQEAALAALDRGGPDFVFEHNEAVNGHNVQLLIASISLRNGDYATAQTMLDELLPGNGLDPSSPTYVQDLMLQIASLTEPVS